MDYEELQTDLNSIVNLLSKKNLLNLESIKSESFLDEINQSSLMITLHDVDLYRPVCINNNMAEFYGFNKNWLKGMDYVYYIKTIHPSAYYTLIESISFFRKDISEFLNLEYRLLYQDREYKYVTGTTKTIIRQQNGKPKYAMTIATLNDNEIETGIGNLFHKLSKREREIAKLLSHGLAKREIANTLFIAESTVETHTRTIYKKLGINKVSELIALTGKYPIEVK